MRIAFLTRREVSGIGAKANGFGPRYAMILEHLVQEHQVSLITLAEAEPVLGPDTARWSDRLEGVHGLQASFRRRLPDKLLSATRGALGMEDRDPATRALIPLLAELDVEAVVVANDWHLPALDALPERYPVVAFVEENFTRLPDLQATHLRWRLTLALEGRVTRRALKRAAVIVVISPAETAWAEATFSPAPVVTVPHSVDLAYWSDAGPTPERSDTEVLVIGQFAHRRNAAGLLDVARALDHDNPKGAQLVVVSRDEPPADLDPRSLTCVRWLGSVDDPRPLYRSAAATLVPSFLVTGAKTTILQGWAARTPVVTTGAAARSLGATPDDDVLAGDNATAVVGQLNRVLSDGALAQRLVDAGSQRLLARHSAAAVGAEVDRILTMLDSTTASPGSP